MYYLRRSVLKVIIDQLCPLILTFDCLGETFKKPPPCLPLTPCDTPPRELYCCACKVRTQREFAQVSGLLPDTNEQFVFHFFPNLHLSLSALKWGAGKGGEGYRKGGGYRLYKSVFVFKESRLAYKCTGEYNTFKVKLINLVVSSFMAIIISRICRKGAWIFFFFFRCKCCQTPPGENSSR